MIRDEIEKLAADGMTARQIAQTLKVSRQAVYSVARKLRIEFTGEPTTTAPRYANPQARVITGGVPTQINATQAGSVSELLVAADLTARGWAVYMPVLRQRGHDLVATSGELVRTFEVRSGRVGAAGQLLFQRDPRMVKSSHYAVVVTGRPVAYEPDLPPAPGYARR